MSDVLQRIASLANSLSQAELRVLLELAVRAEASGAAEIMASSRHLAQSTGLARASVQAAIDSLNARQFIRRRPESNTKAILGDVCNGEQKSVLVRMPKSISANAC